MNLLFSICMTLGAVTGVLGIGLLVGGAVVAAQLDDDDSGSTA